MTDTEEIELAGAVETAMGEQWLVVSPVEDLGEHLGRMSDPEYKAFIEGGPWLACTYAAGLEENR